jgi:hypothetical protein
MARKGIGDFPKVDPTEKVTGKGIAVLLSFFVLYIVLYALSYPLGRFSSHPLLGVPFSSPYSLICLVLALVGLGLVIRHLREYRLNDFAVSFLMSALVWLAVQAKYWYNGWTPTVPYYHPTFIAVEVFLITLGAIGLLKRNRVLRFRLAEDDDRAAVTSLVTGVVIGLPFAVINVLLFVFLNGQQIVIQDVVFSAIMALQPGIMEELVFRLLFMSLAIVVLLKYLPKKVAITSAIFMAIVFHSAVHVPQLVLANPLMAIVTVIVTSTLFGLPMALLAYKKDIETAIGFHWVIDAVRFALGL